MSDERLTQLKIDVEQVWGELKVLMTSMEEDVAKALNGVASATTRARKGLSLVKKNSGILRETLLELRKAKAESKKS